MRKLYQILYNVGRLTDAPGGGRFLSRGDTLAVELFPFLGDTLAVGFPFRGDTLAVGFPFRGDTLAWASLRGGKALGVTKPAFPPRAPPFRARILRRTLWNVLRYWLGDVLQGVEAVRLSRWMRADGKAARAAGLFPVVNGSGFMPVMRQQAGAD